MRVAVIGAGIGGLAVAHGLQRAGADVVVLERSPRPRRSGSGLSVFGNGWTALDAVGAGPAVRQVAGDAVTGLRAGQRTPAGGWLSRTPEHALRDLRIVHRNDLHDALAGGLAPGTVRHGVAAHLDGDQGALRLEPAPGAVPGADDLVVDLVVAADGVRSPARRALGLDTGTRYAGYHAWRGVTGSVVDLGGAAGETWGRGRRFGYAPLRDGRVYWFAVATTPVDGRVEDPAAEHARLLADLDGWHHPVGDLLRATDPAAVTRTPVEDLRAPLSSFRRGRCVLLGDAAHAMTPDLGQGGNQALEDAAVLTTLLRPIASARPGGDRLEAELSRYDALRRPRAQAIAARARRVGRLAQARGRLTVPLRDALVRSVPGSVAARQVAAVQDWRP